MSDIYNNKEAFIKLKPKGLFTVFIFLTIILFALFISTFKIKIYDNYQARGYVNNDGITLITTFIPTNINVEKIQINNKNIDYEIIENEVIIDEENYLSYLKVVLKTDTSYENKSIVSINFYYNKQRLKEKIKEKMF